MNKATENQYVDININLHSDTTVPIVKLENELEIPTIPFIWHREESLNIPIQAIIKIPNESMKQIINTHCNMKELDSDIKNLMLNELEESYIVSQKTILEKVNYYISYHAFAYRENIGNNIPCKEIPRTYDKSIKFQSIICPLINHNNIFSPFSNSQMYKISTGCAYIHGQAFSPPGCFHFKIKEDVEEYIFIAHGKNMVNSKTVTVLFIMINDHNNDELKIPFEKSINEYIIKIVDNVISTAVQKIIYKSPNSKFINILNKYFYNEIDMDIINTTE